MGEEDSPRSRPLLLSCMCMLTCLSCAFTWLRFFPPSGFSHTRTGDSGDWVGPLLEWSDALCICAYALALVWSFGARADTTGLSINGPPSSSAAPVLLVAVRSKA